MTLVEFVLFFVASFFYVGMMGFQTKAVSASNWKIAFFISLSISVGNFFVVTNALNNNFYWFMLSTGLGSALGIMCSILAHDWLAKVFNSVLKKRKENKVKNER